MGGWLVKPNRPILCLKVQVPNCLSQVLAVCCQLDDVSGRPTIISYRCEPGTDLSFKQIIMRILRQLDGHYCLDDRRAAEVKTEEILAEFSLYLDRVEGTVCGIIWGLQNIPNFEDIQGPEAISSLCYVFRKYSQRHPRAKFLFVTDGDQQRRVFQSLEYDELHI